MGDPQMTKYLNNLNYENYIWKTKYNELWQTYTQTLSDYNAVTEELKKCKSPNNYIDQNIENTMEENSLNGNRDKIIILLQNKNTELVKKIIEKDNEIAYLHKILLPDKGTIPSGPPLQPPKPPVY
jgi:vacuolar-type H+-ATPase subunit E/Vma4